MLQTKTTSELFLLVKTPSFIVYTFSSLDGRGMLYNRVVYDLAGVVKLVVDKVSPADRYQALALLKNIAQYLYTCDVTSSVVYDEPLLTVNNLIHTIDEINIVKLPAGKGTGRPGKAHSNPTSVGAAQGRPPVRPPVSRHAAVKRAPPSYESDDDGNDDLGGNSDDDSVGEQQEVQEEVIDQQETDWQPIDMLERALTVIANESSKTSYVYEGSTQSDPKEKKSTKRKSLKGRAKRFLEPKLFLPDDVEFSNPTPRVVTKEGDRRWPENAQWVCVYCRLIVRNLHNYKSHLRIKHRTEEPCSCRFCKREFPNVELFNYHLCKEKHQCHVCLKTFVKGPQRLRAHMRTHFKASMTMATCKECYRRFPTASSCAIHIFDDHETVIHCDSCVSEIDPHEVTPANPARVYCLSCLESANGQEPEALPLNPNSDITITVTNMNTLDKGTSSNSTANPSKRRCDACDEDVVGGPAAWNRHSLMTRHIKAVSLKSGLSIPDFVCDVCNKTFVSEERLQAHSVHHEPGYTSDKPTYTCKICDKVLMTRGGYKSHLASHLGERNYVCQDCGKTFVSSSTLCDHRNAHHRPGVTFPCKICGYKFVDKKRLTRHINVRHDNLVYKCPSCDLEARNSGNLKSHMEMCHPELVWTRPLDYRQRSEHPCPPGLRTLKEPAEDEPGFSWRCDICNMEMRSNLGKQRHLRCASHIAKAAAVSGTQAVMYECDECGKKFASLKYLTAHVDRIHKEDAKRYECDVCNKQFVTAGGMKSHKLLHSGVRNFKCTDCDMAFYRKSVLTDHLASVHAKSNTDYPCDKCDEVFTDRKRRSQHIKKAHHNFVYSCPQCDFEDKNSSNLRKHMKLCHIYETWTTPADYCCDVAERDVAERDVAERDVAEHDVPDVSFDDADDNGSGVEEDDGRTHPAPPSTSSAADKSDSKVVVSAEDEVKKPRLVGIKTGMLSSDGTPVAAPASKRASSDVPAAVPAKKPSSSSSGDEKSNSTVSVRKSQRNRV